MGPSNGSGLGLNGSRYVPPMRSTIHRILNGRSSHHVMPIRYVLIRQSISIVTVDMSVDTEPRGAA